MAYEVEIFGQTYALRTDADEEHVRKVADLVDGKMREVAAGTGAVSTLHIAVLAALELASELTQSQRSAASLTDRVEILTRRMETVVPEAVTG